MGGDAVPNRITNSALQNSSFLIQNSSFLTKDSSLFDAKFIFFTHIKTSPAEDSTAENQPLSGKK